jgi:hypothetical protein
MNETKAIEPSCPWAWKRCTRGPSGAARKVDRRRTQSRSGGSRGSTCARRKSRPDRLATLRCLDLQYDALAQRMAQGIDQRVVECDDVDPPGWPTWCLRVSAQAVRVRCLPMTVQRRHGARSEGHRGNQAFPVGDFGEFQRRCHAHQRHLHGQPAQVDQVLQDLVRPRNVFMW